MVMYKSVDFSKMRRDDKFEEKFNQIASSLDHEKTCAIRE
jgi:hypothetical protein